MQFKLLMSYSYLMILFFPFQSGLVCACSGEIVDGGGVVVCDPNIPEPGFLRLTVMATTNEDFDVNIAALNSRAKASILSEISEFRNYSL